MAATIALTGTAAAQTETSSTGRAKCDTPRCQLKRDYAKLRASTPREPIPTYITECESHGELHARNLSGSGAGGRYQIMPGTWRANLPRRVVIRIAEYLTP